MSFCFWTSSVPVSFFTSVFFANNMNDRNINKRNFCGRTRREFMWQAGGGFAGTALCGMLGNSFFANQATAANQTDEWQNPLAAKPSHFAGKAKSVIFLFMYGGPSHIDTFDYKPGMVGMDNKTIDVKTFGRGGHKNQGRIVEPRWKFKQYGCLLYTSPSPRD